MRVTFIGHACFLLESGEWSILVDPFISGNPTATTDPARLRPTHILLTHAHGDHLGDTEAIARRSGALVISTFEVASDLQEKGLKTHAMAIGGKHRFDFGPLRVTPALHGSGIAGGNPAGFIFELGGKKVYHTGDTGLFTDMKLLAELEGRIDLFLLPIGDNFTMGIDDAVVAVDFVRPALAIPMHYNTFPVIQADPLEFKRKAESRVPETQVIVLKPGESTELR